jgi:hypothetical protein
MSAGVTVTQGRDEGLASISGGAMAHFQQFMIFMAPRR